MAFLKSKGYGFDALISYAHIDNKSTRADNGWIAVFQKRLQLALEGLSGEKSIEIWRDPKLAGNDYFDAVIKESLEKSGLLLVLYSNGYINSDYCTKEIDHFYAHVQKKEDPFGLTVNNKSRIFNITLYNIPNPSWHNALQGRSGYDFYDDAVKEPINPKSKAYKKSIAKLASEIWMMLSSMEKANTDKQAVFFGSFPNSLGYEKELIEDEIKLKAKLVPENFGDLPSQESSRIDKIKEIMASAATSIHLFNENASDKLKDTERPSSIVEAEVALSTDKPQVIWMPSELQQDKIDNPVQKDFLKSIENNTFQKGELTILKCPRPNIPREINEWLQAHIRPDTDVPDNIWLIDREKDDSDNPDRIRRLLKLQDQEMLNYQNSDNLDGAILKARYYLYIVTNKPFTAISRLDNIIKIAPPLLKSKGVYIAPAAKLYNGFASDIIKFENRGFMIHNAVAEVEPAAETNLRKFMQSML